MKAINAAHQKEMEALNKKFQDLRMGTIDKQRGEQNKMVTNKKHVAELMNINSKIGVIAKKIRFYYHQLREINLSRYRKFDVKERVVPKYEEEVVTYCAKHATSIFETENSYRCLTRDNSHKRKVCENDFVNGSCKTTYINVAAICMKWSKSGDFVKCTSLEVVSPKRECTQLSSDKKTCEAAKVVPAAFYCQEKFEDGIECKKGAVLYGMEKYNVYCMKKNSKGACTSYGAKLKSGETEGDYDDFYVVEETASE